MSLAAFRWPDIAALLAACAFILILALSDDLLIGSLRSWPLALLGLAMVAIGCWKHRHWWLLALLPVFLLPLLPFLGLLHACSWGDCL